MRIRVIRVTRNFERSYRKLPRRVQRVAERKELLFRDNPFDTQLKTHRLDVKEREVWAFSVLHSHRIKFIFLTEGEVLFLDIGTHGIYE